MEGYVRALLPGLAAAVVLSSIGIAQTLPPPQSSQPPNRQSITLRGCIKKRTLTVRDGSSSAPGGSYRLRGSKGVLNNLKEHDGHDDEVSGTTTIADDKTFGVGKEKKVGKTRIYGSAGSEDKNGMYERPEDLWIDVETVTHLQSQCAGRFSKP